VASAYAGVKNWRDSRFEYKSKWRNPNMRRVLIAVAVCALASWPANAQRSDTGPANQRSDTGPANQRSDTGPANQRSDTGPANQRSDTGPANQRSDTGPANQRSSATAWQDLTKMPPKELDPAKFQNKALRDPKNLKTNQFTVEYVPPTDKKHTKIYDVARQRQLLEKVQAFLSPLYLPNPVKLQIKGCDGVVNAHFWQNVISVCYEYFDWILQNTPKEKRVGVSPHDAMIGPTVDVFLHEAGHAIFQLLDIPLLGSEEDGADYIATFLTLQFPDDDARRLIVGSTLVFGADAQKEQGRAPALADYADRHSLPAKRYFNRLCMAYGKDPKMYADAIARGKLTKSRASHCSYEYAYISDAFRRLIGPYIDQDLAKEVKARQWFQFDSKSNEALASAPAAR